MPRDLLEIQFLGLESLLLLGQHQGAHRARAGRLELDFSRDAQDQWRGDEDVALLGKRVVRSGCHGILAGSQQNHMGEHQIRF